MIREPIFDLDIDKIENENLTNISLRPESIKPENYSRLEKILRNNPQIESTAVRIKDGSDKFWNNFFKILMPEDREFSIDPTKIVLSGDIDKFNCDIFKYIENIEIRAKDIRKIGNIQAKLPDLRNIEFLDDCILKEEVGDNLDDLCQAIKYMKSIQVEQDLGKEIKEKLGEKFILSADGTCIINTDKIGQKSLEPKDLRISINDLEKIGIDKLQQSGDKITLVINSANDLSNKRIQELQNNGLNISGVRIFTEENTPSQNKIYDIETYSAIREKLEELVEGIDISASDKEKFTEVYKRVCSSIMYDNPAAYPKTKAEQKYSIEQTANCRNLKNGLLEGKTVCAGYADILRNALSMVGVEAQFVKGVVTEKTIKASEFKEDKYSENFIDKKDNGEVIIGEYHAWNKVKLDGVWYNVDPTWDSTKIRLGQAPTHCLKCDEDIKKQDKKIEFSGPECETSADDKEIEEMFGMKHLYIGKIKIPNGKDIFAGIRLMGEAYKDLGIDIKNKIISIKENVFGEDVPKQLPAVKSNIKPEEVKRNSWDLKNYGIDEKEFRNETNSIVEKSQYNSTKSNTDRELRDEK